MNIFVLDKDPLIAAQMHCDKHVNKMVIEHTQMLAAAYYHTIGISRKKEIADNQNLVDELFKGWPRKHEDGTDHPYAITHVNHPCTIWTRTSFENFKWLLECTNELCDEFQRRYSKEHSIKKIINWMYEHLPNLPKIGLTPFAQALPEVYRNEDPTIAYKKYYAYKTTYMSVVWNKLNNAPNWWNPTFVEDSINEYNNQLNIAA